MKKIIVIILFALIAGVFFIFLFFRGGIHGRVVGEVIEKNESYIVSKIFFKGDDGKNIYGLFFQPDKNRFDVIIVLPAAAGTKESRSFYGEILADMGYGSLILDQRGIGETDGNVPSLQEDFFNFVNKKNVFQFLMATDAVRAIDFLDSISEVDEIGILGESMGGRNAMIAAGLDKRIKTAIIISSAGYSGVLDNQQAEEFFDYINPNSYINYISPRKLLMLHAINDSVIPIEDARYTFSLAGEPKKFLEFDESECKHGYCKPMHDFIEEELSESFGIRS